MEYTVLEPGPESLAETATPNQINMQNPNPEPKKLRTGGVLAFSSFQATIMLEIILRVWVFLFYRPRRVCSTFRD